MTPSDRYGYIPVMEDMQRHIIEGEIIDTYKGNETYRDVYVLDRGAYDISFYEYTYGFGGTEDLELIYNDDEYSYLMSLYLSTKFLHPWTERLEQQLERILIPEIREAQEQSYTSVARKCVEYQKILRKHERYDQI